MSSRVEGYEGLKIPLEVEVFQEEEDGPWCAEVEDVRGAMVVGSRNDPREYVIREAQAVALEIIADDIRHGDLRDVSALFTVKEIT